MTERLKAKWPALLDAHYESEVPGPSVCLQDALHMVTTGKVLITCPGAKKRKKDERQEEEGDEEPRTLSELEACKKSHLVSPIDFGLQWGIILVKSHLGSGLHM